MPEKDSGGLIDRIEEGFCGPKETKDPDGLIEIIDKGIFGDPEEEDDEE